MTGIKKFGNRFSSLLLALVLVNCGVFVGNPDEDDSGDGGNQQNPTSPNPTGEQYTGTMSLTIASNTTVASALNLQEQAGTITLADGTLIEAAKFHIGRIKIKSERDDSEEEKELEEELEQKELEEEEEIDEEDEEEKAEEDKVDSIENKYDTLISQAKEQAEQEGKTEDEIDDIVDALKEQEEQEKEESEKKIAELQKKDEDEIEAIEDAKDESLKWKESYTFDALASKITPELKDTEIEAGSFPRIEFKLKPSRSTTTNLDMINKSVVFSGKTTINGQKVNYDFATGEDFNFSLKGQGAIVVSANAKTDVVIKFDVTTWLNGVDLSGATVSSRGNIKIDTLNNKEIYDNIVINIKKSTKFGEDDDGDGDLEDDEEDGDGDEEDD